MRRIPTLTSLLVLFATACAHQARIETDPPGAEVYVNGERVGLGPVEIEDEGGWRKDYEITLRKDGYEPTQVTLTQDTVNMPTLLAAGICGACTCGLGAIYFVPRIWKLDERYRFVMVRKEPLPPIPAAPPPPSPPPVAAPVTPLETPPTPIRY